MAVCLPTGSIFDVNVKTVLFALFAISFVLFIVDQIEEWPTLSEQLFLGIFVMCLCFWAIIGLLRGESKIIEVLLQLKDISSTILLAWFCVFFLRRHLLTPESVIRSVVYAASMVGLFKVGLILSLVVWHMNPVQMIESVFGEASLVSGDIGLGLTRLGFSSDIVGGFAIFAILCPSVSGVRLRPRYVAPLMLMLVISGLLSYARYIWFIDLFAIVAALVIERRFKLLLFSLLTMGVLGGVFYETLTPLFVARFSSEQTSDSDLTRIEQSKALMDEVKARPMLGKGIGQHTQESIRSEQNRYSYELQWMALLMQIGIVGVTAILILVVAAARDLWAIRGATKIWLAALYLLWLAGSWTNPYLTSSFAGATFGMFMAMFYRMRMISAESGLTAGGATSLPSIAR